MFLSICTTTSKRFKVVMIFFALAITMWHGTYCHCCKLCFSNYFSTCLVSVYMIGTKAQQIQNLLMNLNNTGKSCWGKKMHIWNNICLLFLLLLGTTTTKPNTLPFKGSPIICIWVNECSGLTWCIFICLCFFVFAFVCVFASLLHSFALESLHAIWPNTVVNGFLPPPKASKDADYWTPWI